jgi:hypothetical protein
MIDVAQVLFRSDDRKLLPGLSVRLKALHERSILEGCEPVKNLSLFQWQSQPRVRGWLARNVTLRM